jgi:hypothetical protein
LEITELSSKFESVAPLTKSDPRRPHGLAIREDFQGTVEEAESHRYHVATYDCKCGIGYRIFVDEVHYDLGGRFQNYVKGVLEYVHKSGRQHPDIIHIPMEAEF